MDTLYLCEASTKSELLKTGKKWWESFHNEILMKRIKAKGQFVLCWAPHWSHVVGGPTPPSQHFFWSKAKIKVISIWSTTPKNTRNCQKLVEIVAREASHVLWPMVVYWRRGGIIFIGEQPSHKQSIWRLWSWLDEITLKALDDSQSICISLKTSIYTVAESEH